MLPEIERLLVVQDRDRKIRAFKQELKLAPLETKDWDAKLVAANTRLDAAKLKGKEIEVERKKLEDEATKKREQIAKYQVQKFQTRKNEEFQALTNEITRYEGEITQIEDRELDLMESAEKMKAAIAEANKNAQDVKAQVERNLAEIATKTAAVEQHLAELEAERVKLTAEIDEDLLDTYERLFTNKHEAIVGLEHEVCMGCHTKVTAQTRVNLKANKTVVHCENCGRILYAVDS
jgi:predicted  nucleic acid-binding Zn-ribbon protein